MKNRFFNILKIMVYLVTELGGSWVGLHLERKDWANNKKLKVKNQRILDNYSSAFLATYF